MAARKLVKNRVTTNTPAVREPEFGMEVWLQNSKKMIGQPRHVVVGATYGRPVDELYSRAKMTELTKRFLSMR